MISLETNHRMRTLCRLDHYAVRSTTWVWVDRPADPVDATDEEILAVRKEILRRRGAITSARTRAPGPALDADDLAELTNLMKRLDAKLARHG